LFDIADCEFKVAPFHTSRFVLKQYKLKYQTRPLSSSTVVYYSYLHQIISKHSHELLKWVSFLTTHSSKTVLISNLNLTQLF
jgi:hypothetical protein